MNKTNDLSPHQLPLDSLARTLETHLTKGLTDDQAERRRAECGANELRERPRPGFLRLLFDQLNSFLIIILLVAAAVSFLLGESVDAIAILAIVILNSVLGVVQEARAEQALAALKRMAAPNAMVVRDGRQMSIPSRELVPGDIVVLEAGNYVPADLRLIESVNLKINESALTGESHPVQKDARTVLDRDLAIGDQVNSAFMATVITYGRGRGLVTATGMHTQIGMIADMLQSYEDKATPLQRSLDQLGKLLGVVSLVICGGIFVFGVLRDTAPATMLTDGVLAYFEQSQHLLVELFMTAVSLAIAAIPEGLPAVVTICLALGMQRMVSRHALIRKLPAVETLGCATVICSDKTGTLTQNEMTVVAGWAAGREFSVTGEGYTPEGAFREGDRNLNPADRKAIRAVLYGGALCNDALLESSGESEGETTWRMVGDPTEGALVVAAAKAGWPKESLEDRFPRKAEVPFDSERKRMATVHANPSAAPDFPGGAAYAVMVKGAPDLVLGLCDRLLDESGERALSETDRAAVLQSNHGMAARALRVLAVAYRPLADIPASVDAPTLERNLVFAGLLGMIDPPRPEVKDAVAVARAAGLKTVMITGDYADTAQAVAERIGLMTPGDRVLSGADLDALGDAELAAQVDHVNVFARVSPQHKVKIVDALQARGHVVAMTGDGVNDAPALKKADIGVAMGITGTDVAKETATMVLTDDNYASIVSAVEEGRTIYSNIRKFVYYLVACNIGEILIILTAMLAGLPLPLRPIQLLWLNLVTDGAPALALGMEAGEPDTMKRPPRPKTEPVINRNMRIGIAIQATADAVAVLTAFLFGLNRYGDNLAGAQTIAFATLILSELLRSFTSRSERLSVFQLGVFSNRWMLLANGISLFLLVAVIYIPFLDPIFNTVALGLQDWAVILPLAFVAPTAAELTKWVIRRREAGTGKTIK